MHTSTLEWHAFRVIDLVCVLKFIYTSKYSISEAGLTLEASGGLCTFLHFLKEPQMHITFCFRPKLQMWFFVVLLLKIIFDAIFPWKMLEPDSITNHGGKFNGMWKTTIQKIVLSAVSSGLFNTCLFSTNDTITHHASTSIITGRWCWSCSVCSDGRFQTIHWPCNYHLLHFSLFSKTVFNSYFVVLPSVCLGHI